MTRTISRDGHVAVHGLAMRTGCRCPDCGRCRPRRVRFEEDAFDDLFDDGFDEGDDYDEAALEADADYAVRRAAAAARARPRQAPRRPARPAARPPARATVRRPPPRPAGRPPARGATRPAARPPARGAARPAPRPPARVRRRPAAWPAARPPARGAARPAARPAIRRQARPAPQRRAQSPRAVTARRLARTRQPFPQPAPLTPPQRDALNQTVTAFGWTGFRQGPGGPVSMQDLVDFQGGGGVEQRIVRGKPRMVLTDIGKDMLRDNPRFQKLAPLFTDDPGQRIYEIAPAGQLDQPHYVGKTGRKPGERLLEHLHLGKDRTAAELRDAQRDGRLDQLQVADGRFTAPDLGRRSHLGEVALMELTNADWNDPRRHGFEADAFDW